MEELNVVEVKPGVACVVHDAETASLVALRAGMKFPITSSVVRQFEWAFDLDEAGTS